MTPPAVSPQELEAMLKRLHLACARRSYLELVEQAERGAWSFRDFLAALASAEIEHRRQTRLRRCVRQARFPVLHTLEEFDFSRPARTPSPAARLRLRPRVRRPGRLPRAQGPQRARQDASRHRHRPTRPSCTATTPSSPPPTIWSRPSRWRPAMATSVTRSPLTSVPSG